MRPMPHLECAACGRRLTQPCRMGVVSDYHPQVEMGSSPVPAGVMVCRADEDAVPVTQGGAVVRTHVYSPAGSISVGPDGLLRDAVQPSGLRQGCCGPDGMDGPNFSCLCGNVLGTEWGDCWTMAEVRFLPTAVSVVD